mgnify:CR=1 FL=1
MRVLLLLACLCGAPVHAAPLVADLSEHQIAIRSTFTGADILLFGAIDVSEDEDADVIVVVRGPDKPVTVRKKSKIGPIWANADAVEFARAPGFYAVASTRPIGLIAPSTLLDRQEIGLNHLPLTPRDAEIDKAELGEFRRALIRNRVTAELYAEQAGAIRFVGPGLFRTTIRLPANVPVGTYRVQAFLLIDEKVEGAHFSPLFIDKTGFERQVFTLATTMPFVYGIIAVMIAVLAGWAAGAIFRKN